MLTYNYLSVLQKKDLHLMGCDITHIFEKLDQEETLKGWSWDQKSTIISIQ